MALQTSGQISLLDVRTELKKDGKISLDDSDVRKLAEKESGEIKFSDFYGKSSNIKINKSFSYEIVLKLVVIPGNYYGYDKKYGKIKSIKKITGERYENILRKIYLNMYTGETEIILEPDKLVLASFDNIVVFAKGEDEPDEKMLKILDTSNPFSGDLYIVDNKFELQDLLMRLRYQKRDLVLSFDVMFK